MSIVTQGDFNVYGGTEISLTESGGATPSVTEDDINVYGSKGIIIQLLNGVIQVDGTIDDGDSTKVTVFVYGDTGIGYSTDPIATMDVSANSSKILVVTAVNYLMRVKCVNTDSVNATKIKYKIIVSK